MKHLSAILFLTLLGACSAPEQRSVSLEQMPLIEAAEPEQQPATMGRKIRLVEVDPSLDLEESGGLEIGKDNLVILEGAGSAATFYAGVRVNDGPKVWLDLYTDEERAGGISPESGWGWSHLGVTPDDKTIVGVLDWFVESSGPQLFVVTSDDGGRTWYLRAEIPKPHYMATFHSLELDHDQWELKIRLDDCGGCDALPGETLWTSPPGGDDWQMTAEPTVPDKPGH